MVSRARMMMTTFLPAQRLTRARNGSKTNKEKGSSIKSQHLVTSSTARRHFSNVRESYDAECMLCRFVKMPQIVLSRTNWNLLLSTVYHGNRFLVGTISLLSATNRLLMPYNTENKQYDKRKYDKKQNAGAQYHLAGFPPKDKAWKELPWSKCAGCTDKSIKPKPARKIIDTLAANTKTTEPKVTRPKTSQPKTPPPKIPAPKTCTPEHKKASKCKDDTRGTCGPTKTNRQFYDEYLKLLKAGRAPCRRRRLVVARKLDRERRLELLESLDYGRSRGRFDRGLDHS